MENENNLRPEASTAKTLCEFTIGSKMVRLRIVKGTLPPIYTDDDGVLKTSMVTGPNQRTRFMLDIDERTSQSSASST